MSRQYNYIVCTRCWTYNQKNYIKETLSGFSCQQATFPLLFVIVDDASTDGEAELLEQWSRENLIVSEDRDNSFIEKPYGRIISARHRINQNSHFVILLLYDNHYQQRKSKLPYIKEYIESAKYSAMCEGDDYWTDPFKLQKQVDVMENNNSFSFCFHKCRTTSGKQKYPEVTNKSILTAKDIILNHYVPTASLLYKTELMKKVTYYRLTISDIPMEIQLAMNGDVAYIDNYMSVYRDDNVGSITHNKRHNRRGIYDYLKMYSLLWWKYKFRKYSIYLFYKMLRSIAQIPLIYRNVYLRN